MYLTEAMLEAAARRWGTPRRISLAFGISERERDMIRGSRRDGRSHDITVFIRRADGFAVIAKPWYGPGLWRAPSGALKPGEELETGAKREAYEETGLAVDLERYLVRVDAAFWCGAEVEPWHTHVFLARAGAGELDPKDTSEISGARWATREEIQGPIRTALLDTGAGLFRYRVALTDEAFEALDPDRPAQRR
jgi:8-oxo-dGTP pyrophosphatase MutT (NUDIX family)